jgi:polysaccharide biosynthesis protein PslJ
MRVALLVYTVACLASLVAAMTREITDTEVLGAYRGVIDLVAWFGLVIVISQTVTDLGALETLLRRALVLGSVVAAIGIFEFYSKINITDYIHIPGLTTAGTVTTAALRDGLARPSSTADQPLELASVMSMLLPFALHQALYPSRRGLIRQWLPVVLIAAAIPMTVSRTGIIGVVVALVILVLTWNRQQKIWFSIYAALSVVALKFAASGLITTIINFVQGTFGSNVSGDIGVTSRTSAWAADWQYIVARPIFGRGFRTFVPQIYRFNDNQYLTSLVETGFIGLACFCALFLAALHCAGSGRRLARDAKSRHLGQAIVASIAAGAVCSATFDALEFSMFCGILFFVFGAAAAYRAVILSESLQPRSTG